MLCIYGYDDGSVCVYINKYVYVCGCDNEYVNVCISGEIWYDMGVGGVECVYVYVYVYVGLSRELQN